MNDLMAWWNLVFVLPLAGGLLLLLAQAAGALATDVEAELHADADGHAEGDGDSWIANALSLLGVGRVPTSLVLMTFSILWGGIGWLVNAALEPHVGAPMCLVPAVLIAGAGSLLGTAGFTRAMSRLVPSSESYATRPTQLLGKEGEAVFDISEGFGRVRVRDDYGNLQDVSCRIAAGGTPIAAGQRAVLVRYEDETGIYFVAVSSLEGGRLVRPDSARVTS